MIYTRRGPVYHKFADVCQCDLSKNMFKYHVDPICDALAQKVLIAHKLVFS